MGDLEVFTKYGTAKFVLICADPEVWRATVRGARGYGKDRQEALISALERLACAVPSPGALEVMYGPDDQWPDDLPPATVHGAHSSRYPSRCR